MLVKLGDIATYINGYAFKPNDWSKEGLPIIRIQDLTGNSYEQNRYNGKYPEKVELKNGDIIISWYASIGVYIWNGGKALLNQHIFKVVFDKMLIDKNYFVYAVEYRLKDLVSKTHGSTMKHIVKQDFDNTLIPYPELSQQHRIVAILDQVNDLISIRNQQLEQLDLLIKSRFVEMFGNIYKEEYKYPTEKLGKIANVGSSHRVFTTEFVKNGIPFYRGTEIGLLANGEEIKETYYISEEHYQRITSDDSKPQIGDLLLPSICDKGQVWMVNSEKPFYYKDGRVLSIRPNIEIIVPKFLEQYMKIKTIIEYPKLGSGSTFAEFKIFLLKDIDIVVPPLALQNQFAAFVEEVEKEKATVKQSLEWLNTLKASLMQEYFG